MLCIQLLKMNANILYAYIVLPRLAGSHCMSTFRCRGLREAIVCLHFIAAACGRPLYAYIALLRLAGGHCMPTLHCCGLRRTIVQSVVYVLTDCLNNAWNKLLGYLYGLWDTDHVKGSFWFQGGNC